MELQILVSKKGTKVVTASNLYQALELPTAQYARLVRRGLEDVYEFRDGLRRPVSMQDFAPRPVKDSLVKDYYFSLELARQWALRTNSKHKAKYARLLLEQDEKAEHGELLSREQLLQVLDLTRVMGLISCQVAAERQHMALYESRNGGDASNWWAHREELTGLRLAELRREVERRGKSSVGKSMRQMLILVDRYEMIRLAIIDLFMAMGKSDRFARSMGDFSKVMAAELEVPILDDRKALPNAFLPPVDVELARDIQGMDPARLRSLWEQRQQAG